MAGLGYLFKVYWDFICHVDVMADSWEGKVYRHSSFNSLHLLTYFFIIIIQRETYFVHTVFSLTATTSFLRLSTGRWNR